MGILNFGKNKSIIKSQSEPETSSKNNILFIDVGLEFISPKITSESPASQIEAAYYWKQLEAEGLAYINSHNNYVLPWAEFYQLQKDPNHQPSLARFNFPSITALTPIIRSHGALTDSDFQIVMEGWRDPNGTSKRGAKRTGGLLEIDRQSFLLTESTWKLCETIREFSRLVGHKKIHDNELHWSKIRRLAIQAKAGMDDFLRKTIVLQPETLQLHMRRNTQRDEPLVEIQPGFENAPENWLEAFDGFNEVQNRYSIPLPEGGIAHVLIAPEVKSVLNEIKKMPGRRVSGDRARSFLRNPYAQLGGNAENVIPPEIFEQAKDEAGIFLFNFNIQQHLDTDGRFQHAILNLDEQSTRDAPSITLTLQDKTHAWKFVQTAMGDVQKHNSSTFWAGYELALTGLSREYIHQLQTQLENTENQLSQAQADTVLNLGNYSDRVIDIGNAQVLHSPFIQRDSGEAGWIPESINDDLPPLPEKVTQELVDAVREEIDKAEYLGKVDVQLPHLPDPIDIYAAKVIANRLEKALEKQTEIDSEVVQQDPKPARSVLIIGHNIDDIDYVKERADTLYFDTTTAKPKLPKSIRPQTQLREHQLVGVAWLQHLHRFAPDHLSGCLLADDMGLGKTVQLLSFIGDYLETATIKRPALIIAPVSLLENWEAELDKFFFNSFGDTLKLYGNNLSNRKIKKHDVPKALLEKGITNLLVPDWRGKADIVLTTYETLRDLEFSLALEHWSIMVCDEAQKIKVPSTLMTQAAKAQKADFKIACTGTPVENSLTDLWCLFDLIQPGLLDALNVFGKKYRRPIERAEGVDETALQELRELIEPQILRRTKRDVAKDLPAKLEDPHCKQLPISRLQEQLYSQSINDYRKAMAGPDTNNAAMLSALHKMRMICAHPLTFSPQSSVDESPKVQWLLSRLREIRDKQEKVIIFTEFREIQTFLQLTLLRHFGLNITVINGDTNANSEKGASRQKLIDLFQNTPGFNVIILSTTAVGFGVNVQAANHVIHYTRCWNPAKEDQATDRAYRIGQQRDVTVYYPTIHTSQFDTFEVKLDRLLSSKRKLAGDMLNGTGEISIKELANEVLR